jgi:hypothetical protein
MSAQVAGSPEVVQGHITHCQGCGRPDLELVLDLGHHAPCDSLLTEEQLAMPETAYPLRFCRCTSCGLAQIDYAVDPDIVFFREYPYRTAMTRLLRDHFGELTSEATRRLDLGSDDLAIDLGSNDGTLLQGFKAQGVRVLGVEPTGIADIAIADGVPTINSFFDESVAAAIVAEHGHASVVTGANMFAHVNNLYPMLRGVSDLLGPEGVFISESHYLLDLIEEVQYDTIYHEHLRFYSLRPLKEILERVGFSVFDVERVPTHGGSIRVWSDRGQREPSPRVAELLALEEERGINDGSAFARFRERVVESKHRLLAILLDARSRGRIYGLGAPGRASTILTYAGIGPDLVEAILELDGSLKIGQYTPGSHIPIIEERAGLASAPETLLVLSWHIGEEIVPKLRERGFQGMFVIPLPAPRTV